MSLLKIRRCEIILKGTTFLAKLVVVRERQFSKNEITPNIVRRQSDCHTLKREKITTACVNCVKERFMAMQEEQEGKPKLITNSKRMLGYKLQYLNASHSQIIHSVEAKRLHVKDISQHLQRGESVLITPKLQETSQARTRDLTQLPWYFTHL